MSKQIGPTTWEFDGPGGVKLRGNGSDERAAKRDAVQVYNKKAVAPAPGVSTGTPEQRRDLDLVGRVKEALVGEPVGGAQLGGDIRDPSTLGTATRAIGQQMLPGSWPEAAVMAVLPFAGKAATGVVGGARGALAGAGRAAVRIGVPTAAGAAAGVASGGKEGAAQGALTGLTAAGVAEAFAGTGSLVEAASRRWGNLETRAFQTRVRNVLGPDMALRIEQDIPSLKGRINSTSDIIKLTDEATGRKVLGDMFDAQEKRIGTALAGQQFPVAEETVKISQGKPLPANVGPPSAVQTPAGQTARVRVLDAQGVIDVAKRLRFIAAQKDNPLSVPAKQEAEKLLDQVTQSLRQKPNGGALADTYEGLRHDYRKFLSLRDFLGQNTDKLFPGMTSKGGGTIDLVLFGDRLIKNFADVTPSDFPALHELFTGPGGSAGTRPVAGSVPLVGRARAGIPIPGMEGVRVYEGGRLSTTQLPPNLQEQVKSPVPGRLAPVGRGVAAGATPAIGGAIESQGP